jgi:hypothetical protein
MSWFQSTRTTESRCPRCHASILTGLDEGLTARVDATPLPNPQAEIDAIIRDLRTYTLTQFGWLVFRDATRIKGGTPRGTIHAEHKCTGNAQLALIGD